MARFRRSGVNWEGRKWRTPASLNALLDEIESAFPASRSLDGTVASKAHDQNNPSSDHRPRPTSGDGIVRAVDIGETEPEGDVIAEALRASKDPRIKYVIHERRIFSSYNHSAGAAWTWRPYSGYNAHLTHVHVSIVSTKDSDGSQWNLGLSHPPTTGGIELFCQYGHGYTTPPADSGLTGDQSGMKQVVIFSQNWLNRAGAGLEIDGVYGPSTVEAVKAYGSSKDGKHVSGWVLDNIIAAGMVPLIRSVAGEIAGDAHDHDGRYIKTVTATR